MRLLVFGIDGLTFDVVRPLAERGVLPGFKRMLEGGAYGVLRSTIPAVTPPAWTSISTGVNPGRHGVFDFQHLDEDYGCVMVNARSKRAPDVWDLAPSSRCIIAHLPVTYPLREINGMIVGGMLTPSIAADFAKPPDLARRVRQAMPDYQFDVDWLKYLGRTEKMVETCERLIGQRRGLLNMLAGEEWDLLFFVLTELDRAQHMLWGEPSLEALYRSVDGILQSLLETYGGRADILVVSDHGFQGVSRRIHVNSLLEELGWLRWRDTGRGAAWGLRSSVRKQLRGLAGHGFFKKAFEMVPEWLVDRGFDLFGGSGGGWWPPDHLDMERTRAFMTGQGCLYLNLAGRFARGRVREAEGGRVAESIAEDLRGAVDPATGTAMFAGVWLGREVYRGPFTGFGPDIILEPAAGCTLSSQPEAGVLERLGSGRGDHHPDGVFLAYGPDIRRGETNGTGVCDIAPTILHILGEKVPRDLEGRLVGGIFDPASPLDREADLVDRGLSTWTSRRLSDLKRNGKI